MLSGGAENINLIVFDLTQSGLKPMIHYTRSKHAKVLLHH